ncbi:MAG: 4Fe-4S binding protein [Clostridiales bacterium]|nr:4Fe-4S binding protein [Clostridiales bacterium]MCF8023477.1 4Fe-4S binding protein [Clostridiales bacterium]
MLTNKIKDKGCELGINMVGVVSAEEIDKYAGMEVPWKNTYFKKTTDYLENAKSVIVLGFDAQDDVCDVAYNKNGQWIYTGEMLLSVRQRDLALTLQREGLQVYAGYPMISHKHLAWLGGLGAFGKNSMIVTREFGPQVRFRCIITDAVLEYDEPFTGDLCGDCTKCIEACPVGAIYDYKIEPEGCFLGKHIKGKHVDPDILAKHEKQITECSHIMCRECQKVCPYSK